MVSTGFTYVSMFCSSAVFAVSDKQLLGTLPTPRGSSSVLHQVAVKTNTNLYFKIKIYINHSYSWHALDKKQV